MDRATDKMDKAISRSKGTAQKNVSIIDQYKQAFPDTWREEIKKARAAFVKG